MPDGSYPIWRTIRERYWKNRAQLDPNGFGPQNIGLMKKGYAPRARVIVRDRKTGEIYEKLVKRKYIMQWEIEGFLVLMNQFTFEKYGHGNMKNFYLLVEN